MLDKVFNSNKDDKDNMDNNDNEESRYECNIVEEFDMTMENIKNTKSIGFMRCSMFLKE